MSVSRMNVRDKDGRLLGSVPVYRNDLKVGDIHASLIKVHGELLGIVSKHTDSRHRKKLCLVFREDKTHLIERILGWRPLGTNKR